MLEKETMISVTNRDNGSVSYIIPDLGNLYRRFESGETKEISMNELRKLSYIPGGDVILQNYLIIDNEEAVYELLNEVEPEYFYREKDIVKLLKEGSLAQLEDCLDFAPEGTIDLVKSLAVKIQLNDVAKRKAILEKTGFDVTSAININIMDQEDTEPEPTRKRRTSAFVPGEEKEATTSKRRTAPVTESKYKIIKKG